MLRVMAMGVAFRKLIGALKLPIAENWLHLVVLGAVTEAGTLPTEANWRRLVASQESATMENLPKTANRSQRVAFGGGAKVTKATKK